MSPNTLPVFEALPVEVLGNILRQMASPEDVYSTIRASPKALGSFDSFREAILVKVLQAHLPAEIFAEYLGLLHIPKYEDLNYVPGRRDLKKLVAIEWELREIGWVFWEDVRRLDYLGWLTRDTDPDADNNIQRSLEDLAHRNKPKRFEAEDDYPEESMYVTEEDFQGELSAKYAFGSFYEAGSYLFLDGLRDISDWPSKKISPAFKEICQGSLTSG
ncbi:hypothetical protein SLS63_004861 [Diaporthe eres]|uniref:F-box domain-containing protein n=1 Tax=Diaporthe eres TaxID=83184 RepID=A0ABR1PCE6_DIAER